MTKRSMYTGTKLINYMHFGFVDIKQSVLSYFFMDNELWPKTNYKRVRVLSAPNHGTVVYEDLGNEQIAYVFRGNPCTNFEQVKELFACL